jgi:hypothetical protein
MTFDTTSGPFMDTGCCHEKPRSCHHTPTRQSRNLAGALGVPAVVGLTLVPDWRWFLNTRGFPLVSLAAPRSRQNQPGKLGEVRLAARLPGRCSSTIRNSSKTPEEYRLADGDMNRLIRGRHGLYVSINKHDSTSAARWSSTANSRKLEVDLFEQVVLPAGSWWKRGANIGVPNSQKRFRWLGSWRKRPSPCL